MAAFPADAAAAGVAPAGTTEGARPAADCTADRATMHDVTPDVARASGVPLRGGTVILKIARACGFLHSTSPIPPMDINATRRYPQT